MINLGDETHCCEAEIPKSWQHESELSATRFDIAPHVAPTPQGIIASQSQNHSVAGLGRTLKPTRPQPLAQGHLPQPGAPSMALSPPRSGAPPCSEQQFQHLATSR